MIIKNITSFGRSGVSDWFLQRVSAIVLFFYVLWLSLYCCFQTIDYTSWRALFALVPVQIATVLALISLLVHAWIGMWTIATDYIKPPLLRIAFEVVVIAALGVFLLWGIHILWS
jgi:succinate dehydrogenase / fumarate reductase membrane anchor subunit